MKAAVCYETNKPLKIDDVALDDLQEHEILVKLEACGVCHTDVHFMKGETPIPLPLVMGHEGAGIVEKVGPGVTRLQPGDHVVLTITFSCGECQPCLKGRQMVCVQNLPAMGGAVLPVSGQTRLQKNGQSLHHFFGLACFAEYTVVHERSAIKIRDDAPLDVVCTLGCGVSTGLGASMKAARIEAGESVIIFGCGGVGLAAVMGAKLSNAGKLIAVDTLDHKLEKAKELGATHTINASHDDPMMSVLELLGGGADCAIECIGNVNVIGQAVGSIRSGGRVIVAGMAPFMDSVSIPGYEFMMGKTIAGTVHGNITAHADIPVFVDLFMEGKLPIDKLITKTYSLDQVNDAFEALEAGETIKSVVKL